VRDFSWHVFKETGDIEAYLLYKDLDALRRGESAADEDAKSDPADLSRTDAT